ncbi:rpl13A (nucleomorph) [Hemiselmis andersenii]|uniref:Rpl13A n=1 Tax=Hemiselmis andersenii TaxID=464988 RepID=A9BK48_HEMAN|nr:rpl13A [Hemiselmis andersenii]ABW97881.1 rpl13A [Hemiselmis andersenii]|mmetsp:Transcript_20894/g.48286  ORF Transcript_20894/g.48286 Transcript_20894/m.48286 type:complete len:197 (-) Transcript_20894:1835-2425(-)
MKSFWLIEGQGHLAGRLASICAKELLNGNKIIIVKAEKIEISGKHIRNKLKFLVKSKKRTNTNPKRGPFHFHSPSQIFWKMVRGMLPHKTKKGTSALMKLKVFEGLPEPFNRMKKFIIPSALRVSRLLTGRKYSILGEIANQIGWTRKNIIDSIVWNRNIESKLFYNQKVNSLKKKTANYNAKVSFISNLMNLNFQ